MNQRSPKTANRDMMCHSCCGTIPTGHVYWSDDAPEDQPSDLFPEHINCELYTAAGGIHNG